MTGGDDFAGMWGDLTAHVIRSKSVFLTVRIAKKLRHILSRCTHRPCRSWRGFFMSVLTELIMVLQCPQCGSTRIHIKHYGKKAGGAIGTTAGAVGGAVGTVEGAQIGATLGILGGPPAALIGGVCGAVIGGLLGAVAGCTTGVTVGEYIDDTLLDNYHCLACQQHFALSDLG